MTFDSTQRQATLTQHFSQAWMTHVRSITEPERADEYDIVLIDSKDMPEEAGSPRKPLRPTTIAPCGRSCASASTGGR